MFNSWECLDVLLYQYSIHSDNLRLDLDNFSLWYLTLLRLSAGSIFYRISYEGEEIKRMILGCDFFIRIKWQWQERGGRGGPRPRQILLWIFHGLAKLLERQESRKNGKSCSEFQSTFRRARTDKKIWEKGGVKMETCPLSRIGMGNAFPLFQRRQFLEILFESQAFFSLEKTADRCVEMFKIQIYQVPT